MPFNLKTIPIFLEAKSQIHHGGDNKTGSETLFRRQEYLVGNTYIDCPLIHGNALRGVWRREIMEDLGERLDLGYKDEAASFQVNKDVYHALFTGGQFKEVAEKDSGKIFFKLKKQMRNLIPPLSLLGTAFMSQQIEGKLNISHLLPLCSELEHYLPSEIPKKFQNRLNLSVFEQLEFMFQTRKDELREQRKEGEQAVQMLIKYEVMKPGTVFYAEAKLIDYSDLDLSCFAHLLDLWGTNPHIGGKSAVGLGSVKPYITMEADSSLYLEFIETNRDKITKFLEDL